MHNQIITNRRNVSGPKEEGLLLSRHFRNLVAHNAWVASSAQTIKIALFTVMLKYLEDNRYELGIVVPEELLSTNRDYSSNERMCLSLKEFLEEIELMYGLKGSSKSIYSDLTDFGIDKMMEEIKKTLNYFAKLDLSGGEGKQRAAGIAVGLLYYLSAFSIQNVPTIPWSLLKLLDHISGINEGMSCYGITGDSGSTLSYLTASIDCSVTIQQNYEYSAIDSMLWIIAGTPHSFKGCLDNVEWLPVSSTPVKYDRVYAFPAFQSDIDIKTVFDRTGTKAQDYISWWPDMLGTGQWVYARRILKALKDDGVGFVLFPLGMLSRMGVFVEVRKAFLNENAIDAVIELPAGMYDNTATKTALLIIKKHRDENKVRMINLNSSAAKELLTKGSDRRVGFDAEKVAAMLDNEENVQSVSEAVSIEKIVQNGYCLSPSAYISQAYDFGVTGQDVNVLIEDAEELWDTLEAGQKKYYSTLEAYRTLQRKWEGTE